MRSPRTFAIWGILALAVAVPIVAAAFSPQLAWRSPVYIAAGFFGILAMALLLIQPLLMSTYLPGIPPLLGRRIHRWTGSLLVASVVLHVAGLWITSPPDVIDALTFTSPTPFSDWGVIAMWALFATALLAAFRSKLRLRPRNWRIAHTFLALVIVAGSVAHAMLIEGTMETLSKVMLCALVIAATMKVIYDFWVWVRRTPPRTS
ncbi:MAG: ferric reductase-like transmembrane domain-containing protein [Hyphomicrobiales bacterium]